MIYDDCIYFYDLALKLNIIYNISIVFILLLHKYMYSIIYIHYNDQHTILESLQMIIIALYIP